MESEGLDRSAARKEKPGMMRQAIMRTCVLAERLFACQGARTGANSRASQIEVVEDWLLARWSKSRTAIA